MDLTQLETLAAVVEEGSFEGAAYELDVTSSAVSQRIKALELATGRVLLRRSRPVEATVEGERYVRLARQLAALVTEAAAEPAPTVIPIAVGADALATWVLPALAAAGDGVTFDVRREDESRTAELLRDGTVMAAITTDSRPVQGCTVTRLGAMRYRPVASRDLVDRWFPAGVSTASLSRAPLVVFDRSDALQDDYLRARGVDPAAPPRHHIPASTEFARAVRMGFGWGMLPDQQVDDDLVLLDESGAVEVVHHWQQWALPLPGLERLAATIAEAAARDLRS